MRAPEAVLSQDLDILFTIGSHVSLQPPDITALLRRVSTGDRSAEADLIPRVYEELRRLASRYLRGERRAHSLQTTALVHEAYLKLVDRQGTDWKDRNHFFAVASTIMRRILVDHARRRGANKRGGDWTPIDLDAAMIGTEKQDQLVLALEEALDRLDQLDPRQTQIVVMRFYGGLTADEIAEVLGISIRTVKREWMLAKTWLHAELSR